MPKIAAVRYHDFSIGHRVYGHEGACAHAHGHNHRVTFHCEGLQDELGRVIDFSVIKHKLCQWLEDNWDHHFMLWEEDPWLEPMRAIDPTVVSVPFNPTAENIGQYLIEVVGPKQLEGTGVTLTKVTVEETRKCSATVKL